MTKRRPTSHGHKPPMGKPNHGHKPPPPPAHASKPGSCPLELVTTVPVVIVMLLAKAAWRRVRR